MEKGIESNVDFSPTDDLLFKLIFSDKRCEHLLIHLLNSVLDSKNNPVTEVHIENTEVVPDVFDGRGVRLDVCAKTEDGRLCDIEIQKADKGNMFERSLFYWARLFSRRLNKNDSFGKLRQTICINILEFNLFKDKDEYWNTYHITNDRNGTRYKSDLLELHFIEMGKMHGFSKDCPLTLWVEYLKN
ncbi:MAG: Rpn family recombination-promoting nuclease/putative transposase, partial [Holosporales bacterium]|nr:Rpn family recombination-promoting nuclease/putative transposase [Holosporales bacterium]